MVQRWFGGGSSDDLRVMIIGQDVFLDAKRDIKGLQQGAGLQ